MNGAGQYRDRVSIQSSTKSIDEYGGNVDVWTTDKTRSCKIKPIRTTEKLESGGESVQATYEITFRYEPGILGESKRLLDSRVSPNRFLDIESVIDDGNYSKEIIVLATERKWPRR